MGIPKSVGNHFFWTYWVEECLCGHSMSEDMKKI